MNSPAYCSQCGYRFRPLESSCPRCKADQAALAKGALNAATCAGGAPVGVEPGAGLSLLPRGGSPPGAGYRRRRFPALAVIIPAAFVMYLMAWTLLQIGRAQRTPRAITPEEQCVAMACRFLNVYQRFGKAGVVMRYPKFADSDTRGEDPVRITGFDPESIHTVPIVPGATAGAGLWVVCHVSAQKSNGIWVTGQEMVWATPTDLVLYDFKQDPPRSP